MYNVRRSQNRENHEPYFLSLIGKQPDHNINPGLAETQILLSRNLGKLGRIG